MGDHAHNWQHKWVAPQEHADYMKLYYVYSSKFNAWIDTVTFTSYQLTGAITFIHFFAAYKYVTQ